MGALKQFLFRLASLPRKYAVGGAIGLVLVAVLFGMTVRGKDAEAIAATLRNPLSVFAARSPGTRPDGVLYQTKHKLAATHRKRRPRIALPPHERVLSTGRSRPPLNLALAPDSRLALLGRPAAFPIAPGIGLPDAATPAFDVPAFGFGDTPGFSGASGGPPDTQTPPANVPGPAVPEPATWLMLIVGVGLIGRALRQRGLPMARSARA